MKKVFVITGSIAAILVGAVTLAGCGAVKTNSAPITQPIQSVQKSLSASFQAKLSSPWSRLRGVSKLPSDAAEIGQTAKNVLYIAPSEQYAIVQFRIAWDRLPSKPAVVWTGSTESNAQSVWAKEGYQSDPLPVANTLYVAQTLPTPDSYHRKGKVWQEEPGITSNKAVSFWIKFFEN